MGCLWWGFLLFLLCKQTTTELFGRIEFIESKQLIEVRLPCTFLYLNASAYQTEVHPAFLLTPVQKSLAVYSRIWAS